MAVTGGDDLIAALEAWAATMIDLAEIAMQKVMASLEGWAKDEHPWQNKSGDLQASIEGKVTEIAPTVITGVLSASTDYAVFVELARDGAWGWLWDVAIRHKADILQIIRETMQMKRGTAPLVVPNPNLPADYEAAKAAIRAARGR